MLNRHRHRGQTSNCFATAASGSNMPSGLNFGQAPAFRASDRVLESGCSPDLIHSDEVRERTPAMEPMVISLGGRGRAIRVCRPVTGWRRLFGPSSTLLVLVGLADRSVVSR